MSIQQRLTGVNAGGQPAGSRWWVLTTVAFAQLMVVLDATIVSIALPSAQKDLGFTIDDRQWIVTAYALAFGSLLLFGGRLSDLIGRKRALIFGLIGFAGASAFGGFAANFAELAAARAIQGAFGALLAPTALAVLTTTFTVPAERRKAFGIWGAIAGAGGGIGVLLGGVLTQDISWRSTLLINIGFAVLATIGAFLFVPRTLRDGSPPRLDVFGTVLISAGLFGIVYGFSDASTDGWSTFDTWGYLAIGGMILVGFVALQARVAHPMLPLSILKDRDRAAGFVVLLVVGAGILGLFFFLSYYLQSALHLSPIETGLAFLPMIFTLVLSAAASSTRIVPRFGQKIITPIGMLIVGGSLIYLAQLNSTSTYASSVLPTLVLVGLGLGAIVPSSLEAATLGVAPEHVGVASALVNTVQQVGGSIGTAVFNTVAATAATGYLAAHAAVGSEAIRAAQLDSYSTAFWWIAFLFIGAAVLEAAVIRPKTKSPVPSGSAQLAS